MVVLVDAENLVDKSNTHKNLQFIYFSKNECFPNKTDNKLQIPVLTSSIQHTMEAWSIKKDKQEKFKGMFVVKEEGTQFFCR